MKESECLLHPLMTWMNFKLFRFWREKVPCWFNKFNCWFIAFWITNVSKTMGQNSLLSVNIALQIDKIVINLCFWSINSFIWNFSNRLDLSKSIESLLFEFLSEFILQTISFKISLSFNSNVMLIRNLKMSSFNINLQVLSEFLRLTMEPWCDFTKYFFSLFHSKNFISFFDLRYQLKSFRSHDFRISRETFNSWFCIHDLLPLSTSTCWVFLKTGVSWCSIITLWSSKDENSNWDQDMFH